MPDQISQLREFTALRLFEQITRNITEKNWHISTPNSFFDRRAFPRNKELRSLTLYHRVYTVHYFFAKRTSIGTSNRKSSLGAQKWPGNRERKVKSSNVACVPRVTRGRGKITRSYVTVQNYANWQEVVIVEQWFKCRGFTPRISGRLLKNSREIADIFNDCETIFSLFIFFYRLRCQKHSKFWIKLSFI